MTETSTLTAQEMADKIAELEGQVLALREALSDLTAQAEDDDAKMLGSISHGTIVASRDALTDTAQAGREAEARIKAEGAELVGRSIQESTNNDIPVYRNGLLVAAKIAAEEANRLRNGGSTDGE